MSLNTWFIYGDWNTCCAKRCPTVECLKLVPLSPWNLRICFNCVAKRETVGGWACHDCVAVVDICIGGILCKGSVWWLCILVRREDLGILLYFAIKSLIVSMLLCVILCVGFCFLRTLETVANKGGGGLLHPQSWRSHCSLYCRCVELDAVLA